MKHKLICGIIILLLHSLAVSCKSQKNTTLAECKDLTTASAVVSSEQSSTQSIDYLTSVMSADSMYVVLTADSIVTTSGGTLYNPRIDFGAMRPTIGKEQISERTENSLTEHRDSLWQETSETVEREESKSAVAVVEPIEKNDWRWAMILVCVIVALLLCFRKKIMSLFS